MFQQRYAFWVLFTVIHRTPTKQRADVLTLGKLRKNADKETFCRQFSMKP